VSAVSSGYVLRRIQGHRGRKKEIRERKERETTERQKNEGRVL
jgi:hypothetical protein